jgi:hypothetical protein
MSDVKPDAEAFLGRLAEFRNGLPAGEAAMMDAVVWHATEPEPAASGAPADIPDEEQRAFFAKLERYRDSRPEAEQQLVDAMVVKAGAAEPPEVEAHQIWVLWEKVGHPDSWLWYRQQCEGQLPVPSYYNLRTGGVKGVLESDSGSPMLFTSNRMYKCVAARWGG